MPSDKNKTLYYIWVFDPEDGEAHVHKTDGNVLDHPSHADLARKHPHPERVHGYAHRIVNGWRIFDWTFKPVKDRYVFKKVHAALKEVDRG